MASISPEQLGPELQRLLTLYHKDVVEKVNAAGDKASKKLLKLTKATAPAKTGQLKRHLTVVQTTKVGGDREFEWGAKAPKHRILHLAVHGHATRHGRARGNPFLKDALDAVLPEYEKDVEEAVKP